MRFAVATLFGALGIALSTSAQTSETPSSAGAMPRGNPPGWRRVFADDFRAGLRSSKWGTYTGQPGGDPGGWWDPSHVVVKNGVLNLQSYRDPRFGNRWVSGGVSNAPALKQTYGKYLVRFRVDAGEGIAAILLLWPSDDNWPPEIDFGEDGGETAQRNHMTATLHFGSADKQTERTVHANFSRWHTLGVEWSPGRLVYTLDRRRWASLASSQVPDKPMEMDIQTQAGTCGVSYAPCPDSSTPSRVDMQVDWVIAYAYRRAAEPKLH